MKKKALALALLLAIFVSLVAGMHAVEVASANFLPGPPSINFDSPEENKTFTTDSIWLNITLRTFFDSGNASRVVECSLDGEENNTIPVVYEGLDGDTYSTVTGSLLLSELSEGSHSITVYATYTYGTYFTSNSKTINFIVELLEPTPSPESQIAPLPSSLVFVASVGTALTVIGLFIYFRKRKH